MEYYFAVYGYQLKLLIGLEGPHQYTQIRLHCVTRVLDVSQCAITHQVGTLRDDIVNRTWGMERGLNDPLHTTGPLSAPGEALI
ncbi:hypothetical protein NDU88_003686 [Pleurodeles waltl]|uniref:Uncharacterized protein n=1 Tax=Pleurodeles waltl TaxID=8319 RepID=A0AAV7KZP1_PLEWA|nr:hypothetical protein NDU88_003683 [Pleurodeles waltl]KAJ1083527.1 hypothetical protein NDU88_003686 [Pleurodeles waltl]